MKHTENQIEEVKGKFQKESSAAGLFGFEYKERELQDGHFQEKKRADKLFIDLHVLEDLQL